MPNIMETGMAWLASQLKANAASEITYSRGSDDVTLQATYGRKLLKLTDIDGAIRMEWTDMDFVFDAADLILDGSQVEPARGDKVTLVVGEDVQIYEVLPFQSEPPWRYTDPFQTMIRVHTKRVGSEIY
jgi:hypothetical protein